MNGIAIFTAGVAVLFEMVVHGGSEIRAVVGKKGRIDQRKSVTGGNTNCGSSALNFLMFYLPALLSNARIEFSVLMIDKTSRPIINIYLTGRGGFGILSCLKQSGMWFTKVIIIKAVNAGGDIIFKCPLADTFLIGYTT